MKKVSVKILAMLMVMFQGFIAASCSDDDETVEIVTPKVSFERPSYALATGNLEIKVTADVAPVSDIVIPVSIASQTAKEGTDYTMPVKNVTIKAGQTSGAITISRVDESVGENNLELTVNLGQGNGYNLGLRNFVTVTLLSENGYILSFSDATARVKCDQEIELTVAPMVGFASLPAEETFDLEIDTEGTTAVEGTHFTMDKKVTIAAKKRAGSFNIKLLKVEEGKDQIVVRIVEKAGYAFGSNPVITLTLSGLDDLTGTWAFKEWENAESLDMWGDMIDKELAPKFSANDKITFTGNSNEYTFTPSLTGNLKDYFGTEARTIKYSGMEKYLVAVGITTTYPLFQVYMIPDVNIKFTDKETEKRSAKVGFRLINVGTEEILQCVIDDYVPGEGNIYGDIFFEGEDSTHPASYFDYRLNFTRVK